MKKIFTTAITLLIFTTSLFANKKDEGLEVTKHIARPGLTVLVFNYDRSITYNKQLVEGDKYNYNDIYDSKRKLYSPKYKSGKEDQIIDDNWFKKNNIGQRIISYIFNRKADGTMDDSIVRARGVYAATTVQKMEADATMLGSKIALQDFGYEMLDNNYLLVIFKYTSAGTKGEAILYHLELPEAFLSDESLGKAWILPSDDETIRKEKREAFEKIEYEFKEVARINISGIGEFFTADIEDKIMRKLENKVSALAPQSPVFSTKPVTSRIGKKENLRNGARYDAYKYVLRNGEVEAVRTAKLRATTIAKNEDDNTLLSEFTPIAGYGIKEGYILKQHRDLKLSLSPTYRIGAMEGYGLSFDFLTKIRTNGYKKTNGLYAYCKSYDIMDMAGDRYDYILSDPELFDSGNWVAVNFGYIGVRTWRVARFFEVGASYSLGMEFISIGDNYENYKNNFYTSMVTFTPEAVLRINIAYPVQLVVSAGYVLSLAKSSSDSDFNETESVYNSAFSVLDDLGAKRTGLTFSAGLSISF